VHFDALTAWRRHDHAGRKRKTDWPVLCRTGSAPPVAAVSDIAVGQFAGCAGLTYSPVEHFSVCLKSTEAIALAGQRAAYTVCSPFRVTKSVSHVLNTTMTMEKTITKLRIEGRESEITKRMSRYEENLKVARPQLHTG
jgi:hypothetical protein